METSHRDEFLMDRSLRFSQSLKDVKNLRKQLYSAADYFEVSYGKEEEDQQQIEMENLKDYAIKALIKTLDHLGSVADKINSFLDEKMIDVSGTQLRLSCIEQRLRTSQRFIDQGGMFQQSLALNFPRHHKRYILPGTSSAGYSRSKYPTTEDSMSWLKTAVQATGQEFSQTTSRKKNSLFYSPQVSSKPRTFQFAQITSTQIEEKQCMPPIHSYLIRTRSLTKSSISKNLSGTIQRYPSQPQRSYTSTDREKSKDVVQNSSKSKSLFKSLLSMRKSAKSSTVHKY